MGFFCFGPAILVFYVGFLFCHGAPIFLFFYFCILGFFVGLSLFGNEILFSSTNKKNFHINDVFLQFKFCTQNLMTEYEMLNESVNKFDGKCLIECLK